MSDINISIPDSDPFKNIGEISKAIEGDKSGSLKGATVSTLEGLNKEIVFQKVPLGKKGGMGLRTRITYLIKTQNGDGKSIKGVQWVTVDSADVETAKKAVASYILQSKASLQQKLDQSGVEQETSASADFISAKSFTYAESVGSSTSSLSTEGLSKTHTFTYEVSTLNNFLQKTIEKVDNVASDLGVKTNKNTDKKIKTEGAAKVEEKTVPSKKSVKLNKTADLVNRVAIKSLFNKSPISFTKELARGKDKVIHRVDRSKFEKLNSQKSLSPLGQIQLDKQFKELDERVYIIPVKGRQMAMKNELKIVEDIRENLIKKNETPDECAKRTNLAIDTTIMKGTDRFVAQSAKAKGDLSDYVQKKISWSDRGQVGRDLINGLFNLHKSGTFHGDFKLDNVLVFKGGRGQVADFGKSVKGGSKHYKGNMRNMAPEGGTSEKGDVYSAGISLIRIFEEQFLQGGKGVSKDSKMLVDVGEKNHESRVHPKEGRRGIIRYILEHKDFKYACENGTPKGKVEDLSRRVRNFFDPSSLRNHSKQDSALAKYVDNLESRINGMGGDGTKICLLIREMTTSNPEHRLEMKEVLEKYDNIFVGLQKT